MYFVLFVGISAINEPTITLCYANQEKGKNNTKR